MRSNRFYYPVAMHALVMFLVAALCVGSAFAQSVESSAEMWSRVEKWPEGTNLTLVLADGSSIAGTLVSVAAEVIVVTEQNLTTTHAFKRSAVRAVSVVEPLTTPTAYRATGLPNADLVHQVVGALGIGMKVEGNTSSGRKFRGRIQTIEPDGFRVGATQVAYQDVREVHKAGLHWAAKTAIGIAAVVGVLVASWFHAVTTGPS